MLSRRIPQCRPGQARLAQLRPSLHPQAQAQTQIRPRPGAARAGQSRLLSSTKPNDIHSLTQTQIRPQLPFLTTTIIRPSPWSSTHLRQHFTRLVSTESRDYYKRRISRGLRIGLSFYAILVLFQVIRLGLYQEGIEQRWPTPAEWSWKCRWCLRSARALMNPEEIGKLMTNWPMVAGYLRELIEILEAELAPGTGTGVDGTGIEGGLDIEEKSNEWKKGYFQALISAAKAAENLDGWVTDRKQKISAPAEYMVGPSNPRPTPMPAGQTKVPREEDCEAASDSPAAFYTKILTTKGFNVDQRVDAALAYADWLGYMGLTETESDMYQWALDIAGAGSEAEAGKVDRRGVIAKAQSPSENILRVSTALGVHHVKRGDLSTALSVFTSVLRARDISLSSETETLPETLPAAETTTDPISPITTLRNMIFGTPTPSPAERNTNCATAALKTYIGEIIYATSSRETGLAWTRDAVETAESLISPVSTASGKEKEACTDCLKVALRNWQTMLEQLIARAEADELSAKNGWFSSSSKKKDEKERWLRERDVLEGKTRRVAFDDVGLSGGLTGQGLFV